MEDRQPPLEHFALVGVLLEASLALGAIGVGWLFDYRPAETFEPSAAAAGWGLAATVPALILFWACLRCRWGPLTRLTRLFDQQLVPWFRGCGLAEIAAISVVAGIGEELLFRGLIQGGVGQWIGGPAGLWIGLAAGSLMFGFAHPLSVTYAVMTTLVGLYLGWLWIATGNLLAPIVTHAAYDFVAMVYLVRFRTPGADCSSRRDCADGAGGERNAHR